MKRHRRNSGKPIRARSLAAGLLYALLTAFLVACSSFGGQPGVDQLAAGDGPAYLLTVDLTKGDTQEEIIALHGGEIEAWVEGHFAVLGFSAQEAEQGAGEFGLLGAGKGLQPNLQFATDPNAIEMQGTSGLWAGGTSTLWAGGTSRIWAGGTSYLWAGGTSYLWAGGHFQWMPENTAVWKQIRLDEAHRMVANTLGAGVTVAVIDTGVDLEHPALQEALGQGYDFVDEDSEPDEEGTEADAGYGHGTNVAGIVRQIAPRATIVPYRVLDTDGTGRANVLVDAILRAVDDGADIINLSLGGAQTDTAVVKALGHAWLKGVYVVASTGDSGNETVTFPASFAPVSPYLVSLTSVNKDDIKSDFAPHHQYQVELSSPGEFIFGPAPDMKAAAWSGTSMSAPMAAGALALALGAERGQLDLRIRESILPELMTTFSEDINHLNPDYFGELGDGRLDVASFLTAVLEPGSGPSHPNDDEDKGFGGRPGWDRNDRDEEDSQWRGRSGERVNAFGHSSSNRNRGN